MISPLHPADSSDRSRLLKRLLQLLSFALLTLYTVLGLIPDPGRVVGTSINDLAMHFGGYALLYVFFRAAFGPMVWRRPLLVPLFVYSVLIETGQLFVPHRHFEIRDIAANLLGLLAGWAAAAVAVKFRRLGSTRRR